MSSIPAEELETPPPDVTMTDEFSDFDHVVPQPQSQLQFQLQSYAGPIPWGKCTPQYITHQRLLGEGLMLTDDGDPATQQQNDRPAPQFQTFDPRALLGPKAAGKRPASEADSDRGREESANAGQVSLVERLHNVQERTASPSKRVKTEGDDRKQPPANFSSSGALNMKSADNQTPQLPQSSSVDLTMSDDDDEVEFVKDNRMQVICIGRVKQVYVQSHAVPYPDPSKYRGNHGNVGRIKVSFRRAGSQKNTSIIMVVDPTGLEFGRVDMKSAQGLAPLMDSARLNGLLWMSMVDPRRKLPNEGPPGTPLSALLNLTLQLYCPRKVAQDMGKYLKTKNMFLGDPILELNKYDYYNPQTKQSFLKQDATQAVFGGGGGAQNASVSSNYVLRSVEEIRSDVLSMFDTIINNTEKPERDQSPMITTPLMTHQRQALHFMWDKESDWTEGDTERKDSLYKAHFRDNGTRYYVHVITGEETRKSPESTRGGILADEMGLGKTLSILSLVADQESMAAARKFAEKAPPPNTNSHRKLLKNSRATLLVCPLSTMVNWKQQLEAHFKGSNQLKWCFYHGGKRGLIGVEGLADHDLIITTYHMVGSDMLDNRAAMGKPLKYVNFFRIVLDEAHAIRSGNTKQAKGIYELAAQRRWAVTGTPVQNRLEDLAALFRFLKLKPFHEAAGFNTFILNPFKAADPDVVPKLQLLVSSMTLRRLKEGNVDLPPRTELTVRLQFSNDERRLHDWFEQDSARQVNAATAGEKLGGSAYARILKAILYLRLICAHGRDLLGDEALKLTDGMSYENPVDIEGDQERAPALTKKSAYEMLELLQQTDTDKCQFSTCRRSILKDGSDVDEGEEEEDEDLIGHMTPCYHIICPKHYQKLKTQWEQGTTEDGRVTCEFCDADIRPVAFDLKYTEWNDFDDERERIKRDPKLAKKMGAYTGPHTKTKALLEELQRSQEESLANPDEPPIKSVIFSCWTTHLDLIQIALENYGHRYTRLDGRMDRKKRDNALTVFANDPSIPIILLSIGAGGLGLNLTTANKVYIMEPQFNPAAEAQAMDRVHRLGQKRPVTIMKFIMDHSFEEKMLELQRKKKDLADLTMAREKGSKEEKAKKRLEDLRSLFR